MSCPLLVGLEVGLKESGHWASTSTLPTFVQQRRQRVSWEGLHVERQGVNELTRTLAPSDSRPKSGPCMGIVTWNCEVMALSVEPCWRMR